MMRKRYLEYLKVVKKNSERTLKQYDVILKEFENFELSKEGFSEYLKHISTNAPASQSVKLVVIKGYLNWLKNQGVLKDDFWSDAKPPRFKPQPHYLTKEELEKFFLVINNRYYYHLFKLMVNTGMRISEALNLTPDDVTFAEDRAIIKIRGKGNKERSIVVSRNIIENAINAGLFEKKRAVRSVQNAFKRYLKKAGISKDVTPHSLRHTFAILMLERGVPLNVLQSVLGHESLTTTAIYLKISPKNISVPTLV